MKTNEYHFCKSLTLKFWKRVNQKRNQVSPKHWKKPVGKRSLRLITLKTRENKFLQFMSFTRLEKKLNQFFENQLTFKNKLIEFLQVIEFYQFKNVRIKFLHDLTDDEGGSWISADCDDWKRNSSIVTLA